MTVKSFLDCEREKMLKLNNLQLPHQFRKVGIILFVISIISLIIAALSVDSLLVKQIAKYGMLIALLIISISKEKIEDELSIKLRMQSYTFSFICGILYALVLPFVNYLFDFVLSAENPNIEGLGDFSILWILLTVQVLFFESLKRFHK